MTEQLTAAVGVSTTPARSGAVLRTLRRRPGTALALAFLLVLVVTSVVAPLFLHPNAFEAAKRLKGPSASHWFGTDNFGRDVLARTLFGARASLTVGAVTMAITAVAGTALGILASMVRWVDMIVMRIVDGIMSFPIIVLALALTAIMGGGLTTVIIALVVVFGPGMTRVVRGAALVVAGLPMIDAAKAVGASRGRIFMRYVLPHCLTPITVQAAIVFTQSVLVESALSFIGAGLPPDVPSWGSALSDARSYLMGAPWMWAFPGGALVLTILALNTVIDTVRDTLDPRGGDL
jgi:peptide/nickel transport system permease protein